MQDWAVIVADPARLDEFIEAYDSGELSDDERFVLMETILQSFEELPAPLDSDPRWTRVLDAIGRDIALHACTMEYWSVPDSEGPEEQFRVTPDIRAMLARH